MRLRLYMPGDFEPLYAIEEACFQPPFRFSRRYMKRLVEAPNAATWIAEIDHGMAGFAIVEWTREIGGTAAYIQTIEVVPAARRAGIGSALLDCAEESAVAAGAASLWLHVDAKNAAAIRLYEAHGFRFFQTEDHFYAPGRGAHLYRKTLIADEAVSS
jgi:ribosomal protein S18 acetylase RimI-like enzyme